MRKLFAVLFLAVLSKFSFGSHVPGGQITYECVGPNQYKIILNIFEDCGTAFTGTSPEYITITNDCGLANPMGGSVAATQTIYQQDVSQLCPTALSECDGGPYPGVYLHQYEVTVTLPAGCDSWHFSYSSCCRNLATNSTTYDSYYWEATLNNVDAPCNNSPTFASAPIPYVCVGQDVCYSFGVIETDGDSISFSFINAMSSAGVSITYVGGYSGAVPIPGITLDPVTGQINFTPTVAGNYIVAVQVTEYDDAGNIIGTIMRDIQFEVVACVNDIVDCSTAGTIPSSSIVGAVIQTGPTSLQMCEGVPFCFTVTFTDPDPADILTISSNVALVLPGSTFTTTPGNTAEATICWTPPAGSASAYTSFSMLVEDNACPVSGQQTIVYTMDVLGGTTAGADQTICGTQSATLGAYGGSVFTWTALPGGDPITVGSNFSCNPCANPVATPSVTTTYVVTSDLSGSCDNVDTVTVFVVPDFQFLVTQSSPTSCLMDDIAINTTITGGTTTGPFTYSWDPSAGLSADDIANPIFTATAPGSYDFVLTVENAFGCTYTDTVSISVAPSYSPDVTAYASTDTLMPGETVTLWVDLGGGIPASCGASLTGCTGPVSNITAGTFTTQNTTTTYPTPFGNWYANEKHQFLYTAAELNALGFIGGKINSIGFNVISLGGLTTYPNYTVKMACTGLTALPATGTFSTPAFTTVYGPINRTVTTGVNTINLTTNYEWDGVSNIIVEVCYDWTAMYSYTTNCIVQLSTTSFTSSNWFNSDGTAACPSTTFYGSSSTRPVTYFGYCPSEPDSTAYSYSWTPVTTSPSTLTTSASPINSTTYCVVVTDIAGGCTDTSCVFVYVDHLCDPPILTGTNLTCYQSGDGQIVAEMVGDTGPWTVDYELGGVNVGSSTLVTTFDSLMNLAAGTYNVIITDTAGCQDSTQIVITEPNEFIITAAPDDTICINGSYNLTVTSTGGTGTANYVWSNDLTATGAGPHTVNPLVNSVYVVNAIDANGCVADDDTVYVNIYPPLNVTTSGDVQLCMEASTTFTTTASGGNGGPYTYTWYNAAGATIGSSSSLTVTPTTNNAQYCVILSDGCTTPDDTACAITTFFPEPYPSFTVDTTRGCAPVTVTFDNTTPFTQSVVWNFGDGGTDTNPLTTTHVFATPSTDCYDVTLTVTSPDGCVHDTTIVDMICVLDYPTANFTYHPQPVDILAPNVTFDNFSTPDATVYNWYIYDSLANLIGTSNAFEPSYSFPITGPGEYPVTLIVVNASGCADTTTGTVVIGDLFSLYVPNAFTPTASTGTNDIFMPVGRNHEISEYEFMIFNRWGEMVFRTTELGKGWDGTMNNIKCPSDTYVWKIKVKSTLNGQRIERIGHVTLLR